MVLRASKIFQKGDERILGDGNFVESVLKTANEQMEFDTGTVTGAVDWTNFCFTYTITAE